MTGDNKNIEIKRQKSKRRGLFRWLGKLVIILLLLIDILFLILSNPHLQNFIARKTAGYITSKTGNNTRVDSIVIDFHKGINIKGIKILDHNQNEMIVIDKMQTGLMRNLFSIIFTGKMDFSHANFENLYIHNIKTPGDTLSNLKRFFAGFSGGKKKKKNKCLEINLEQISIKGLVFINEDKGEDKKETYRIPLAFVKIKNMDLCKKTLSIDDITLFNPFIDIVRNKVSTIVNPIRYPFRKNKFDIYINHIHVNNGKYRYSAKSSNPGKARAFHFNPSEYGFDSIYFDMNDVSVQRNKKTTLDLKSAAMQGQYGFNIKNALIENIVFTPVSTSMNIRHLQTDGSSITGDALFRYKTLNALRKFADSVTMDVTFIKSTVKFSDIGYFISNKKAGEFFDSNSRRKMKLNGRLRGNIANLSSQHFAVNIDNKAYVSSAFKFNNILTKGKEHLRLKGLHIISNTAFLGAFLPFVDFDEKFYRLENIKFDGDFEGTFKAFNTTGNLVTSIGKSRFNLFTRLNQNTRNNLYKGEIVIEDFDLGTFLDNPAIGKAGSKVDLTEGYRIFSSDIQARLKSHIDSIEYKGYKYRDINISTTIDSKKFNGDFNIQDPNIHLQLEGLVDLSDTLPVFNLHADINTLNLYNLNLYKKELNIKSKLQMDLMGNNFDDFSGEIKIKNATLSDSHKKFYLDSLNITSVVNANGERYLDFDSDVFSSYFDGKYKLKFIKPAILNMFNKHFAKFLRGIKPDIMQNDTFADYYYDFNIFFEDSKDLISILTGKDFRFHKLDITGNANHYKDSLNLIVNAKSFGFRKYIFNNINSHFNMYQDFGDFAISSNNILINKIKISQFAFNADVDNDELNFEFSLDSVGKELHSLAFSGRTIPLKDSLGIVIYGGKFALLDNYMEFAGQNNIVIAKNYINLEDFVLKDGESKFIIDNTPDHKGVIITIKDFNISLVNLLMKYDKLQFSGNTNGYVKIPDIFKRHYLESEITIPRLKINNDPYGHFEGKIKIDTLNKSKLNFVTTLNSDHQLYSGKGFYNLKEKTFFGDFTLNRFPLSFMEYILADGVSETKGKANVHMQVYGPFKKLDISGKGIVYGGETKVNYTGVKYFFDNQKFSITNTGIDFTGVTLLDTYGNTGKVNGGVTFERFRHWGVDVELYSDHILALNTTKDINPDYWGTGIGKVDATFKGKFQEVIFMNINTKTAEGTSLTIPVKKYVEQSEESFIKFQRKEKTKSKKKKNVNGVKFDLELNVNITTEAKITIIMDERAGDNLQGRGTGLIRLLVKQDGEIEMYGDFTFEEGKYLFTLGINNIVFINKEFIIRKGSKIVWSGDPFDAKLDIKADYYKKRISIVDFLAEYPLLQNSNYKADVKLTLILKGILLRPDISFDFEFLNIDESLKSFVLSKMQRVKSDPEVLNTQAVGILVWGTVLPDENINQTIYNSSITNSSSAVFNTVSEFIATRLSSYITGFLSEFTTGNNIISGIDFTLDSKNSTFIPGKLDEYDPSSFYLNLNTTLWLYNNKIKVEFGGGGYSGKSIFQKKNSFLSDENVKVEFFLNKEKTLKMKIFFNRQYRIFPEEDWEINSGIGLSYSKEFGKIFKKKKKAKEEKK